MRDAMRRKTMESEVDNVIKQLRHPKEKVYGALMYVFGVLGWVAIVGIVALASRAPEARGLIVILIEIAVFALVYALIRIFYRAHMFGHYVLLGPDQFPQLHAMVEKGAATLGLAKTPEAFVYNSNGMMNAFAMRIFGRRYVMLTSALIDADNDEQVRFVIGHELGHHAAGHLSFWRNLIKFPGHFTPFLGAAYSRARELTCDRAGAYLAQNLDASRGALQMLACGSARLNAQMNRQAFEAQEAMVPPITGLIKHVFSHYPRHTARVKALSVYFAQPAA